MLTRHVVLQKEPKHASGNQDGKDAGDPEEHRRSGNPWAKRSWTHSKGAEMELKEVSKSSWTV